MSAKPPLAPARKLVTAIGMAFLLVLMIISAYSTGKIPGRGSTTVHNTDPERFNFQVGVMIVFAACSSIYAYVLLLRFLRTRRDRIDAARQRE